MERQPTRKLDVIDRLKEGITTTFTRLTVGQIVLFYRVRLITEDEFAQNLASTIYRGIALQKFTFSKWTIEEETQFARWVCVTTADQLLEARSKATNTVKRLPPESLALAARRAIMLGASKTEEYGERPINLDWLRGLSLDIMYADNPQQLQEKLRLFINNPPRMPES